MYSLIIILQGGDDVNMRTNEYLKMRVGEISKSRKIMIMHCGCPVEANILEIWRKALNECSR
jgi:hypothetical protein